MGKFNFRNIHTSFIECISIPMYIMDDVKIIYFMDPNIQTKLLQVKYTTYS